MWWLSVRDSGFVFQHFSLQRESLMIFVWCQQFLSLKRKTKRNILLHLLLPLSSLHLYFCSHRIRVCPVVVFVLFCSKLCSIVFHWVCGPFSSITLCFCFISFLFHFLSFSFFFSNPSKQFLLQHGRSIFNSLITALFVIWSTLSPHSFARMAPQQ